MKVQYSRKFLFFCILLVMPQANSANVCLQVEGLSGELKRNIWTRLSTIGIHKKISGERLQNRVDNLIRQELRSLGYYSPIVNFFFKPAVGRDCDILTAHIILGKPVKIAGINVTLRGEARKDNDYLQLVSGGKLAIGAVLNHSAYDKFKNSFSSLALRKGYFDAEFLKSQLSIVPSRYQAYWDIDFNSGQRYRFGKIRFHGAQICRDYLQNLAKICEGKFYSAEFLAKLNHRLVATNWFSSVIISPDFSSGKQSKRLPLNAIVTPRNRNSLEIGFGYATDLGLRFKTILNKPWINSHGQSLQTRLNWSTPGQSADITYKIPLITDPVEQYYLLKSSLKREDTNDIQSNSIILNISRSWDLSSGWQRAINLRWSLDQFTKRNVTDTTMLIYPGISINRTRQRGGLMPIWGDSQRYSVDISNTIWGSDVDFIIVQIQSIWIRTIGERYRFVARGNVGWIETNNFECIPFSLRFFAGGDHSIRGYKYQSISPHGNDGELTGASKLVTGSLEYQYNVIDKWWGAIFIDSGEVMKDIKESNFKTGVGIGVRWQSPLGPIKLDISVPVADKREHSMQFYIGLGPEL